MLKIDSLGITEADHHHAFIQRRDVACDERVGGIHHGYAMEIDVGAGKLRRDVFYVIRQTAQDAVDRIRSNVESYDSKLHGGGLSLGIATAFSGDELVAALKRADELMYLDKHQKRNISQLNGKQG